MYFSHSFFGVALARCDQPPFFIYARSTRNLEFRGTIHLILKGVDSMVFFVLIVFFL